LEVVGHVCHGISQKVCRGQASILAGAASNKLGKAFV
jgi:predicted hydrocarbon binding protein